jgi:phospholipase/carboxylesterase
MSNEQSEQDFIHHFVPTATSETAPTLLLLHGTGGNENDMLELGSMLVPHASQLSLRGKVLENGMPRFFRRHAEGVLDLEDLRFRTHELVDFVQAASQRYHFDPTRVLAIGFSNGANIAASTLLLRPGALAGAILLHPMVPLIPDSLPDLSNTAVFISGGRQDPLVPLAQTQQLTQLLQQAGASVTLNLHNGGHALNHEDIRNAKNWLKEQSQFA